MSGMGSSLNVASCIDLSALKPDLTYSDIEMACLQGKEYGFFSVCVNPFFLSFAYGILKGTPVKVCGVVGFPFGAHTVKVKVSEAVECIENGASELDVVWNISAFKSGDYRYVERELREIEINTRGVVRKIIVETGFLNLKEKEIALKILLDTGMEFIKTSTGFNTVGAREEDVRLFKSLGGDRIKVKASGGIKDYQTFLRMIRAGADRIGTSSGVSIVEESIRT